MATELEQVFRTLWRQLGGTELEEGAVLIPGRRWRVDFVDRPAMVVFEVEGGVRGRPVSCPKCGHRVYSLRADGSQGGPVMRSGRHTTGKGVAAAVAKQNALALAGYAVLRITSDDLTYDPAEILEPMIAFVRARHVTDLAVPLYEAPAPVPPSGGGGEGGGGARCNHCSQTRSKPSGDGHAPRSIERRARSPSNGPTMPSIRSYQRKRRTLAGTRVLARATTSQPSIPAPPGAASRKRYYDLAPDQTPEELAAIMVADMRADEAARAAVDDAQVPPPPETTVDPSSTS